MAKGIIGYLLDLCLQTYLILSSIFVDSKINSLSLQALSSSLRTQDSALSSWKEISQNYKSACPATIEPLIEELLKDLPSYANRAIQRSRTASYPYKATNIVTAGRPEFEPLPLSPDRPVPEDPRQVFITTLERNHATDKIVEIQHFHWLFLTKTQTGWRLALMFSSIGAGENQPPLPPRDSSQGAIAQAIRTWLRDCRARDLTENRNLDKISPEEPVS